MDTQYTTPKRTPRQLKHTNLARQVVYPVDMFEPNEKWVNVPGFEMPKAPKEWESRQVWAPVRVKRRKRVSEYGGVPPLQEHLNGWNTARNLDREFESVEGQIGGALEKFIKTQKQS